ncbi:MAG: MtnX-like HAD-IB family phosphatase [Ignavibacteriae bacterium]|nr:MtnX-like HAD-IB family phosphatase [Ignavibacteriota bacterium]
MALKVFVDFDGTIARHDVGEAFFREFGGPECDNVIEEYRAGLISAKECFRRETEAIGTLNEQAAHAFLRHQPIDEGFRRFVGFCRENNIESHVVSDGLDYYIKEILVANGLGDVSFFANRFEFHRDNNGGSRPEISFPYDDAECTRCACCKRNIMLTHSGDEDVIVYVGQGYSDHCPVRYADIVFAKEGLQIFCQRRNISYYPYNTLFDVVERLKVLLVNKLRKRHRAELNRREAFMSE